jgi:hypothetical protein
MKSFNLNIRFETRREMSVLPIEEPGNDSVFEVIARARRTDFRGAEISTFVLLRQLREDLSEQAEDEPQSITGSDYLYLTGEEVETDSGRKFRMNWTPSQGLSKCQSADSWPIALGEYLLFIVLGGSTEVSLRGDLFPTAGGS